MTALRDAALRLLAFSAAAGAVDLLLPEGGLKTSAQALLGLLAAQMLLDAALGLFGIG